MAHLFVIHAAELVAAIALVLSLTSIFRIAPFVALAVGCATFGFAAGMSLSFVGKAFGVGFAQAIETAGLAVIAGSIIAAISQSAGALLRTSGAKRGALFAAIGLSSGITASPVSAFAVLTPLRRGVIANGGSATCAGPLAMAFGMVASQGTLLPSPLIIAGTAILEADWHRVVMIGIPIAALSAAMGWVFAVLLGRRVPLGGLDVAAASEPAASSARAALALVVTTLVLLIMLGIQSIGDMPTEPFGGGPAREWLIGLGRPFIILIAGTVLMTFVGGTWSRALWSENGSIANAIARTAPLLLLVGAGGGLQVLAQDARMAEMLAEQVVDPSLGLLLPFLVALVMKAIQGSSLVAAITAAGMVQPLLPALGLDGETGRALAVVAIGVGSVTLSHLNDTFFWVVSLSLGLSPLRGVGLVTVGTAFQAVAAVGGLIGLAAVIK